MTKPKHKRKTYHERWAELSGDERQGVIWCLEYDDDGLTREAILAPERSRAYAIAIGVLSEAANGGR